MKALRFLGRLRFRDATALTYRMGAGVPGDITRAGGKIEPVLVDASAPPTAYGQAVVIDATTQGVRPLVAGDNGLDAIYGIVARPYPLQQNSANPGLNTGVPPTSGIVDVLRSGYMAVSVSGGTTPVKGGRVYIWVAASSGSHVQGGFETAAGGGSNTIELDEKSYWQGGVDANGVGEISFNI